MLIRFRLARLIWPRLPRDVRSFCMQAQAYEDGCHVIDKRHEPGLLFALFPFEPVRVDVAGDTVQMTGLDTLRVAADKADLVTLTVARVHDHH